MVEALLKGVGTFQKNKVNKMEIVFTIRELDEYGKTVLQEGD